MINHAVALLKITPALKVHPSCLSLFLPGRLTPSNPACQPACMYNCLPACLPAWPSYPQFPKRILLHKQMSLHPDFLPPISAFGSREKPHCNTIEPLKRVPTVKTDLHLLDLDFHQDLHPIVLSPRYLTPTYTRFILSGS